MADSKITALTSIGASTDPANDPLVLVDVSDTSMAATGTTKKVTLNQLLGASGTATLASATITGDLTVRTNKLAVTSTGVGIGTASPNAAYILDLTTANDARARQWVADTSFLGSGNLANGYQLRTLGASIDGIKIANYANSVEYLRIDSAGNVGVGVVPSAWASNYKSVQVNPGAGFAGKTDALLLAQNCYFDGANWVNNRASTYSSRYDMNVAGNSVHAWYVYNAVFGTTGNTIPFVQAMTLDASGRLFIGKTSSSAANTGCELQTGTGGNAASVLTADGAFASIMNRLTSDGIIVDLRRQTLSVGNISVTTTGATFNSTSDYRLKESVSPLSGGLARVNALKPSVYKWKSNGSDGEGFLAHELAEVVPAAVNGEKDAVNDDGTIKAQSIDMSRVVPILVAAIKELTARVEALEA